MAQQGEGQMPPQGMPGQPTPEQIQQIQQQIAAEAEKAGISIQEYVERLKAQALAQHQAQQQAMQEQQAQQQQQPIAPGPPKPEAIAMANFLKSQDLKPRTCIFQEKRKELFRVKRALRAINSPAYEKYRKKHPILPEVTDRASLENAFKILPMSLLALRVSKVDAGEGHEGHAHGNQKRVKGLWTVQIEQHQEAEDDMHYMWLYEPTSFKTQIYAALALVGVFAVVMFPLWPIMLRQGVWYLSMGMTGLLGLFFAMAIFRLILFIITTFTTPPGLWLYPNLFEDVGFWDSFKPLWAWHETPEQIKQKIKAKRVEKKARRTARAQGLSPTKANGKAADQPVPVANAQGSTSADVDKGAVVQRAMHASVEEAEDD